MKSSIIPKIVFTPRLTSEIFVVNIYVGQNIPFKRNCPDWGIIITTDHVIVLAFEQLLSSVF